MQQMPFVPHHIQWQQMQRETRITGNITQLFNIGFAACNEANALIVRKNSLIPFLHNPLQLQNYEAITADLNHKLLLVNSTNSDISSVLQSSAKVLSEVNQHQLNRLHKQYSLNLHELERNRHTSDMMYRSSQ